MKKLAFFINQLSNSQQCISIVNNLNKLHDHRDLDIILFRNDLTVCNMNNNFPIMEAVEALDYDGDIVATDFITCYFLDKCLRAKNKYFYIWNVDWNLQNKPYDFITKIYSNPNVDIIARSTNHANLISRVFKKPKYIIEDCNYEQIIQKLVQS